MGVKKQLCGHGDPLLMEASKMHTTTKPTHGHGDPLLMEVVTGLKETLASIHDEKTLGGARGVGERSFSKGDALLQECERYHQAEHDHHEAHQLALHLRRNKFNSLFDPYSNALFDPLLEEYVLPHNTLMQLKAMEKALEVAPQENLLKRRKDNSLFSPYAEAMPDPVLHEYVLPGTTLLELKALKEDMIKKRYIFDELKTRRDHTLESYEVLCDPLVLSYRRKELLFQKAAPPKVHVEATPEEVILTKYRKLNGGDDLLKATEEYHMIPAEVTEYRKVDAGDDLLHAASVYHYTHFVTSE